MHQANVIAMTDPDWQANRDYYRCELAMGLGILATASTLAVWLVRHLLARPELRAKVVDEAAKLDLLDGCLEATAPRADSRKTDWSEASAQCPHLVAAWYETLRLRATLVPRVAMSDFYLSLAPANDRVLVRAGEVILLPMAAFNLDPATWGPDAAIFSAERFLDRHGRLCARTAQKVRAFGVAGNLCPGKRLGFETAMCAVAAVFRHLDLEPVAAAGRFPEPGRVSGISPGFQRLGDDVEARLVRVREMGGDGEKSVLESSGSGPSL